MILERRFAQQNDIQLIGQDLVPELRFCRSHIAAIMFYPCSEQFLQSAFVDQLLLLKIIQALSKECGPKGLKWAALSNALSYRNLPEKSL